MRAGALSSVDGQSEIERFYSNPGAVVERLASPGSNSIEEEILTAEDAEERRGMKGI